MEGGAAVAEEQLATAESLAVRICQTAARVAEILADDQGVDPTLLAELASQYLADVQQLHQIVSAQVPSLSLYRGSAAAGTGLRSYNVDASLRAAMALHDAQLSGI